MRISIMWLAFSVFFLFVGVISAVTKSHRCHYKSKNYHIEPCVMAYAEDSGDSYLWDASYHAFQAGHPDKALEYAHTLANREQSASAYLLEAYMYRANSDNKKALESLERCFKHSDGEDAQPTLFIDVWTSKAAVHLKMGEFSKAETYNKRAYTLATKRLRYARLSGTERQKQIALYQMACVHAVFAAIDQKDGRTTDAKSDVSRALNMLTASIEAGYDNRRHIATDLDLEALHGDPYFESLLKAFD